jgi:hypothetical protein
MGLSGGDIGGVRGWLPRLIVSNFISLQHGNKMTSTLTFNLHQFPELHGHFPSFPIFPAVYSLEVSIHQIIKSHVKGGKTNFSSQAFYQTSGYLLLKQRFDSSEEFQFTSLPKYFSFPILDTGRLFFLS